MEKPQPRTHGVISEPEYQKKSTQEAKSFLIDSHDRILRLTNGATPRRIFSSDQYRYHIRSNRTSGLGPLASHISIVRSTITTRCSTMKQTSPTYP